MGSHLSLLPCAGFVTRLQLGGNSCNDAACMPLVVVDISLDSDGIFFNALMPFSNSSKSVWKRLKLWYEHENMSQLLLICDHLKSRTSILVWARGYVFHFETNNATFWTEHFRWLFPSFSLFNVSCTQIFLLNNGYVFVAVDPFVSHLLSQ